MQDPFLPLEHPAPCRTHLLLVVLLAELVRDFDDASFALEQGLDPLRQEEAVAGRWVLCNAAQCLPSNDLP